MNRLELYSCWFHVVLKNCYKFPKSLINIIPQIAQTKMKFLSVTHSNAFSNLFDNIWWVNNSCFWVNWVPYTNLLNLEYHCNPLFHAICRNTLFFIYWRILEIKCLLINRVVTVEIMNILIFVHFFSTCVMLYIKYK